MNQEHAEKHHPHVWKVRFIVGTIMLALALIGMIFTDIKVGGSWEYWRIMTPVYALLSLGLSLYLRSKKIQAITTTILQEILHWTGVLLAIYLMSVLVNLGFISRFQAGIEVLLLLALATFLAGVYIEPTFLVIGVALGCLVAGVAFIDQYLYGLLIPVVIVAVILLYWLARRKKRQPH